MPYQEKPTIITPNDQTTLFKYMSLEKLLNLLETQTLFFTKVAIFSDPYEGQLTKRMLEIPELESIEHTLNCYRNYMMCSCWHEDWRDTKPMWTQYTNKGQGIAIKTNVASLKKSLMGKHGVHIGRISYINYDNEFFRGLATEQGITVHYHPYLHKRTKFEDECEVRAIINSVDPIMDELKLRNVSLEDNTPSLINQVGQQKFPEINSSGLPYPINIPELIHEIILSPEYEEWIIETITSTIKRYNLNLNIGVSHLRGM